MQMIFQDPYASLDPRLPVGESIVRGPMAFGTSRHEATAEARRWLDRVGLGPQAFGRFPHEFSGGQRQRVCIARALALVVALANPAGRPGHHQRARRDREHTPGPRAQARTGGAAQEADPSPAG
mgnify:CR=1 FL=1